MDSKVAIVTGASRGIGKAISLKLAELGYHLVLAARNKEKLEATAKEVEAKGIKAAICASDLSREIGALAVIETALEEFGRIDLLVNNAGMGIFKSLIETTTEEWRRVMNTNLTSAFVTSREAIKIMQRQKSGTIINIASVVGIKGYPNQGAYTASKHGMMGLTKVIAEEGREYNIRAHVICPGGVDTEMVGDARPDIKKAELIKPEDIAELVTYLVNLPPQTTVDMVHIRRFTSKSF